MARNVEVWMLRTAARIRTLLGTFCRSEHSVALAEPLAIIFRLLNRPHAHRHRCIGSRTTKHGFTQSETDDECSEEAKMHREACEKL